VDRSDQINHAILSGTAGKQCPTFQVSQKLLELEARRVRRERYGAEEGT
jgi:hypothetical protein